MKRTSYVKHLEGAIYLKFNQDFLHICNYDHCGAILLSYYEYRYNLLRSSIESKMMTNRNYKPTTDDLFIDMSPLYLQKATLGLFGRTAIIKSNDLLCELGFIDIQTNAKTTTKIRFNLDEVNNALTSCSLEDFEQGYEEYILKRKKSSCANLNKACTKTNKPCSKTNIIINNNQLEEINNINIISDETYNKQYNNVCLNVSNNINSGDCTFKGNDCIKEISKKKPSKYEQNPERFKFINEKTKEWNATANESIKIRSPRKGEKESNNWIIGKLYDTFGQEKAEIIFNYVMSKGQYRQPHGLLNQINVQNALASYQDPNDEQPRFMNRDEFKYMERTYGKDYDLPQQGDFFKEEPYYAALEWYFSRENSPNEVVKKTREITSKNLKYKNY